MDLKELLVSVTSCFNIFKPVSKSAIFIINGDRMILSNPKVYPESFVNAHKSMKVGECCCGFTAKTGKIVVSDNSLEDSMNTIKYPGMGPQGHICVPLSANKRILGVLSLYLDVGVSVSEGEMDLLYAIGSRIGAAIENITLYEKIKEHNDKNKSVNKGKPYFVIKILFFFDKIFK